MSQYDYKTVAAPRKVKKRRGLKGLDAQFAFTIEEIIQEQAALGWSYLRADTFKLEEPRGFFSSGPKIAERTVLVFQRSRAAGVAARSETAAPRPDAIAPAAHAPPTMAAAPPAPDRGPNQLEEPLATPGLGGASRA